MPFCKFYFKDWLADLQLRQCAPASRAVWADMMCLMGMSKRFGYLEMANGQPMPADEIARLTGNRVPDVEAALRELDAADVFSRDDGGTIFCRRMVKDRANHEAKQRAGALGGRARQATGQASGQATGQAQKPDTRDQTNGGERARPDDPQVQRKQMPADWPLAPAFDALVKTGRFDNLKPELLATLARAYPLAKFEENFGEIVEAARSMVGAIGCPHGWLKTKLSGIEARNVRSNSAGRGGGSGRAGKGPRASRREFPPGTETAGVL